MNGPTRSPWDADTKAVFSVSAHNQELNEAFEAGRRTGWRGAYDQTPLSPTVVDNLKELVQYGDIIIRKVENGYVIRRIPGDHMTGGMQGGVIQTRVVEGDVTEVAKELAAMNATDAMNQAQQENKVPGGMGHGAVAGSR